MDMPERPFGEQALNRGGLWLDTLSHIVHDNVDVQGIRRIGLNGVQEGPEPPGAVAGEATADQPSRRRVEDRE